MPQSGVYIHIPFCEVKCGYCDFYSLPRGHEEWDFQKRYVECLLQEMDLRAPSTKERIQSIFFGGGTPSLLHPELLEKIIFALNKYFIFDASTEISLETNPGTVSKETLISFRNLGINRLSIGVQSFDDVFLKRLGRFHDARQALRTLEEAQAVGFPGLGVDLIFAQHGQTVEHWKKDLKTALDCGVRHLSAYQLTLEPGTLFHEQNRKGLLPPLEEEIQVDSFQTTGELTLEYGLRRYEISNYSVPGDECVHHLNYWNHGDYYGFGVSAVSFFRRGHASFLDELVRQKQTTDFFAFRRQAPRNLRAYLEDPSLSSLDLLSEKQARAEYAMVSLRTVFGFVYQRYTELFGRSAIDDYGELILKWEERGWMKKTCSGFFLHGEGVLHTDEVVLDFFGDL